MLMMLSEADSPSHSTRLHDVESDLLYICCFLPYVDNCKPQSDQYSLYNNLLCVVLHRVLITGQAIITLITNCAVFRIRRHLNERERISLLHVTTANLLLSFRLSLMSVADAYYRDNFSQIAVQWRHFNFCKIAACFNLIGSEVSSA